MPQPMQNRRRQFRSTTAMNTALALLAKAFKFNISQQKQPKKQVGNQVDIYVVQYDANEVGQNAVHNPGIQNVENMNGLSVVPEIANQYGNGNVVTAPAEGNGNGINGNPISNSCRLPQEEEAGIQSTQVECEFMAAADAYEETERVKVNCTLEDTLQQASLSGTQSDNAPVYDSDGSTEVPKYENCYDHGIFNMHTHEVQYTDLQTELDRTKEKLENCIIKKEKEYAVLWNNWYTKCEECKYDKISYDKAYNDMQQKIERLQAQLGDSQAVNNAAKTISPQPARVHSKSKSSCLSNNFEKLEENHRNSLIPKIQKHKSSKCNNIKLAVRNAKSEVVCAMCKQCFVTGNHDVCMLNHVNDMNSRADNQSANVSKLENQKKHKANVRKSKELGFQGSLASSRPSKPRNCLRWVPTGRIFAMCGKLTASSNTGIKSDKSACDKQDY
ncbi:hypothetical protein Tco_1182575 [Tanacetum coccineum]